MIRPQFDSNDYVDSDKGRGSFSEGLAAVGIDDRWGYVNKRGQFVIQPNFSIASSFSFGLAAVETGEGICGARVEYCSYGYIDKTGKMVIEPKFFSSKEFSEGLAAVATDAHSDKANLEGDFIDKWG